MNLFKANRTDLTRSACPISLLSQHLWLLGRCALLLLWALMVHQRHVQGHLHVPAHEGLGRLCQHHPTVSCNESGCVEAALMAAATRAPIMLLPLCCARRLHAETALMPALMAGLMQHLPAADGGREGAQTAVGCTFDRNVERLN